MRIAIVGDIHMNRHALTASMQRAATRGVDRIFYAGDFGYTFDRDFLSTADKLAKKTGLFIDFIDGNHEDFDFIYAHDISPDGYRYITTHVRHIPRGTVLDLDGKEFLFVGGATSVDKDWRVPGQSWWFQEAITRRELETIFANIEGHAIDAVVAHDAPYVPEFISNVGSMFPQDALDASEQHRLVIHDIYDRAQPKVWYHGHYHRRYTRQMNEVWGRVLLEGLGHDGGDTAGLMTIVDTEDL